MTRLKKVETKEPKIIPGTKVGVMDMVPKDLQKTLIKAGREWKYASTVVRENQALKLGSVFFAKDVENTLTSPASVYPEKHRVVPREKLKPKGES